MRTARPATHETAASPGPDRPTALLVALFVIYLLLLTWIVLWKLEVPWTGEPAMRHIKLVPFVASSTYGASHPAEVVANVAFFVPFGLYLGLLAPSWPWWKIAGVVAGASLTLEIAQYVLAVGSTDISDLIANTAGGLAGLGLLALVRRRLHGRTRAVMTRIALAGTGLALLASALVVATPLRYGPPGEHPPPPRHSEMRTSVPG